MRQAQGAFLAAIAACLSTVASLTCPARLDHPVLFLAQLLGIYTGPSCSSFATNGANEKLTLLMLVPAALLVVTAALKLLSSTAEVAEDFWRWSAIFAGTFALPMVFYGLAAAVSRDAFVFFSVGDIFFTLAIAAPLWSFFLGKPDAPRRPMWISDGQRIATAVLISAALFSALYASQRANEEKDVTAEAGAHELGRLYCAADEY